MPAGRARRQRRERVRLARRWNLRFIQCAYASGSGAAATSIGTLPARRCAVPRCGSMWRMMPQSMARSGRMAAMAQTHRGAGRRFGLPGLRHAHASSSARYASAAAMAGWRRRRVVVRRRIAVWYAFAGQRERISTACCSRRSSPPIIRIPRGADHRRRERLSERHAGSLLFLTVPSLQGTIFTIW